MEQNGIIFNFQLDKNRIVQLAWSLDSTYLAVILEPTGNKQDPYLIQIWLRNNWHWYLKYETSWKLQQGTVACIWDTKRFATIHLFGGLDEYKQLDFASEVNVNNNGLIAVVDDNVVKLTPLRQEVVPPPMSSMQLICSQPIQAVSVLNTYESTKLEPDIPVNRESVAVLTSDKRLQIFQSNGATFYDDLDLWYDRDDQETDTTDILQIQPKLNLKILRLDNQQFQQISYTQITWAGQNQMYLVAQLGDDDTSQEVQQQGKTVSSSCLLAVDLEKKQGDTVGVIDQFNFEMPVIKVVQRRLYQNQSSTEGVLVELSNGKVFSLQVSKNFGDISKQVKLQTPKQFQKPCYYIAHIQLPAQSISATQLTSQNLSSQLKIGSGISGSNTTQISAIGLTQEGGQLELLGEGIIATGVISFTVRQDDFGYDCIFYTTIRSSMKILSLYDLKNEIQQFANYSQLDKNQKVQQDDNANFSKIQNRAVEQGSYVISCPQNDIKVVLQLPRGNLEVIKPRYLVLMQVFKLLDNQQYIKALKLADHNRIDLNILCDYKWPSFIDNIALLVDQTKKPGNLLDFVLSLRQGSMFEYDKSMQSFLTSLQDNGILIQQNNGTSIQQHLTEKQSQAANQINLNEKVSRFLNNNQNQQDSNIKKLDQGKKQVTGLINDKTNLQYSIDNKIFVICKALRDQIQNIKSENKRNAMFKVVTMSYVVQQPQDLEGVLGMVKDAKEKQTQDDEIFDQGLAEEALKQVLLYVDPDVLYQAALGMYELELAYMVIANSKNKDPGEYLSYIRNFAEIENDSLRQYEINNHLQRYNKALGNLLEAGPENMQRALDYAEQHDLLKQILNQVQDKSQRNLVYHRYAQYLERKQKFEDAGICFLACQDQEKALSNYKRAQQWQMSLMLANQLKKSEFEINALASGICEDLSASGKCREAAEIAINYIQDVEQAVEYYCEAREWRSALEASSRFQRQDLLKACIAPNVAEAAQQTLEDFQNRNEKLQKYFQRYQDIRLKRQKLQSIVQLQQDGVLNEDNLDTASIQDDQSLISNISNLSLYTQNDGVQQSTHSSTVAPSTVGGRAPQKQKNKNKGKDRRQKKIHQGSPQEEQSLVQYILSLGVSQKQLQEISQLTEILVQLQQIQDAQKIQSVVSSFMESFEQCIMDIMKTHEHFKKALLLQNKELQNDINQIFSVVSSWKDMQEATWKWDIFRT